MKKLVTIFAIAISVICLADEKHNYTVQAQKTECRDTARVLCVGNSFTYFWSTYNMLQEIAWSQGHCLKINAAYVGGYTFADHLADPKTLKMIEKTSAEYRYVFLQNQSTLPALYGREPKRYKPAIRDAKELTERVRMYSPGAKIFIEWTWSFTKRNCAGFGSLENFDKYLEKGTRKTAAACRAGVSPIGKAFAIARSEYPEINLLHTDNHHQSSAGSYLKSCVNYLMIFGGEFDSNVSDCGLEPETASRLRKAALKAVCSK